MQPRRKPEITIRSVTVHDVAESALALGIALAQHADNFARVRAILAQSQVLRGKYSSAVYADTFDWENLINDTIACYRKKCRRGKRSRIRLAVLGAADSTKRSYACQDLTPIPRSSAAFTNILERYHHWCARYR